LGENSNFVEFSWARVLKVKSRKRGYRGSLMYDIIKK